MYSIEPIHPVEIAREAERGLRITWSNGQVHLLESYQLRTNCPCAGCREKRGDTSHAKPLGSNESPPKRSLLKVVSHSAKEELRIQEIWPIGNYALGIRWGDGHDSGIFSYDLLKALAPKETARGTQAP